MHVCYQHHKSNKLERSAFDAHTTGHQCPVGTKSYLNVEPHWAGETEKPVPPHMYGWQRAETSIRPSGMFGYKGLGRDLVQGLHHNSAKSKSLARP
jgi:hypothetical protein